jgi:RNA polymerase sigma factor (sigma-70 family)
MNTQMLMTKSLPSIKVPKKEMEFFKSNPKLSNNDFGAFYIAHREFIDKIIAVGVNSYQNKYDVEDLRQEVLYRLQANDVLSQYDPKQAKLNVFLTMKIKNYIRHAVRDLASIYLSEEEEFDEYKHTVYNKNELFDDVCFQNSLDKLKSKVNSSVWEFICKLQQGLTSTEIAEMENVSRSGINFKYMRVLKSRIVRKLFQ